VGARDPGRLDVVAAADLHRDALGDAGDLRHEHDGNVLGPVFVYSTSLISVSMILASGLSFLGLGVKPPSDSRLNEIEVRKIITPGRAATSGLT
jgi:hypothetical protein